MAGTAAMPPRSSLALPRGGSNRSARSQGGQRRSVQVQLPPALLPQQPIESPPVSPRPPAAPASPVSPGGRQQQQQQQQQQAPPAAVFQPLSPLVVPPAASDLLPEGLQRRRRFVYILCPPMIAIALAAGVSAFYLPGPGTAVAYICACLGAAAVLLAMLLLTVITARAVTLRSVQVVLLGLLPWMIVGDWATAAAGTMRWWMFIVLLIDVGLAVGVGGALLGALLHTTAVWIVVASVEDGFRLGLYDIDDWSKPPEGYLRDLTECARPPCAIGLDGAASKGVSILVILYFDYFMTRYFAGGLQQEKRRSDLMVRTAEQVAACLVRFDLAAAKAALDAAGGGGLSPQLGRSLRTLVDNLACYKPYLPPHVFEEANEAAADDSEAGEAHVGEAGDAVVTLSVDLGTTTADLTSTAPRSGLESVLPRGGSAMTVTKFLSMATSVPSTAQQSGLKRPSDDGSEASTMVGFSPQDSRLLRTAASQPLGAHSPPPLSLHQPRAGHVAQQKRVSLFVCNRSCFLPAASQRRGQGMAEWIAAEVERFQATALSLKGVVELVSADHLHASFGALKSLLGQHRLAAARCAASYTGIAHPQYIADETEDEAQAVQTARFDALPVTSAVCTGVATCGDFGSASMQRFMIIGVVSSFALVMERIAAGWGSMVLIDGEVYDDVQMDWVCRLRKQVFYPKRETERPYQLWELLGERGVQRRASQGEWMYQLESAAPNPWGPYNKALLKWCTGDTAGVQECVAAGLAEEQLGRAVRDALGALSAAVGGGDEASSHSGALQAEKPVCTISATAWAGNPAPVGDWRRTPRSRDDGSPASTYLSTGLC
eukprot:TRINITY_DN15404_c0_g1_i1.p1 TRINITY_DN15404_c0_g1~~TRINITY_DN15404_c0_g1_i1.p1  ORF type:complete len:830 (+),score=230.29 TRINITY_DN15404_c0_g1_i1:75-2564(+)